VRSLKIHAARRQLYLSQNSTCRDYRGSSEGVLVRSAIYTANSITSLFPSTSFPHPSNVIPGTSLKADGLTSSRYRRKQTDNSPTYETTELIDIVVSREAETIAAFCVNIISYVMPRLRVEKESICWHKVGYAVTFHESYLHSRSIYALRKFTP